MGKAINSLSERTIWLLVSVVFACVMLILLIVFTHDMEKPKSPQAAVAAGFNQMFSAGEWKPGMGPKPLLYHPAGFDRLIWKPLPPR
jgi:hypothetical protein